MLMQKDNAARISSCIFKLVQVAHEDNGTQETYSFVVETMRDLDELGLLQQ